MKKKSYLFCWTITAIVLLTFIICTTQKTYAEEGGEAPTQGEITLVGDTSEEPKPSGSSEVPKPSDGSNDTPTSIKPKGKFPSTGELVKTGLSFGGLALIVVVFVFFFFKKRKTAEENDGKGE